MTEVPDTSKIQEYVNDLKRQRDEARYALDITNAELAKVKAAYQTSLANYNKLKSYWESLAATNELSLDVEAAVSLTHNVGLRLKGILGLDVQALECLLADVRSLATDVENYMGNLEDLNQAIEDIKKAKLDKSNPIIKALKDLQTAYAAALQCALKALAASVDTLKVAYQFQLRLVGVIETANVAPCHPDPEGKGAQQKRHPKRRELVPGDEVFLNISLLELLAGALERFCEDFPFFRVGDNYQFYCEYTQTVFEELDEAEKDKNSKKQEVTKLEEEASEMRSRVEGLNKSYDAALAAQAC